MTITAVPPSPTDTSTPTTQTPTDTEVILRIKQDGAKLGIEVSDRQAGYILVMFAEAYETLDQEPVGFYILDEDDDRIAHPVLFYIMKDDVEMPEPGSAHEALNQRFLAGTGMGFVHTKAEKHGLDDEYDCALAIRTVPLTPVA